MSVGEDLQFMYCCLCGTFYVEQADRLRWKCGQASYERTGEVCGGRKYTFTDHAMAAAYRFGGYYAAEELWLMHKTWLKIKESLCP